MGEVYRARDARLGRDVAIKVLPEHLCNDANLKARFEREARAISALSHPHICHLYDVGSQAGTDKLMAAAVETTPTFAASKARVLFERRFEKSVFPFASSYDPSPDGQRFLVVMPPEGEAAATQINMVLSWSDELRRLIHAEK